MTGRLTSLREAAASRRSTLAAGAAALLLALVVALALAGGDGRAAAAPEPEPERSSSTAPTEPSTTLDPSQAPRGRDALPAEDAFPRLLVPTLGIDARVVPVPLREGGVLDPPAAVSEVGWWEDSAEAGADTGQTVLTGHTVHDGGGVMDDLDRLQPGDAVRVTDADGPTDYRVTEVVIWTKAELAANAVETFGQDRHHGRLVMVTCEDWDGSDHTSNVVVFADPLQPAADLAM